MKSFATIAVIIVGLVCTAALTVSIYPGMLNDILFRAFLISILGAPVLVVVGAVVFAWLAWKDRLSQVRIPWRHLGLSILIVLFTLVFLVSNVPRRIAFAVSKSAFQSCMEQTPKTGDDTMSLNKQLGLFRVDKYAIDPRGGTYFRVHAGPDGIGPDEMSYGFCYNPNPNGSPFGAASYQYYSLGDDWYWFQASDDW